MPFDMQEEIVRHRASWKAFVLLIGAALAGTVVMPGLLALTLL